MHLYFPNYLKLLHICTKKVKNSLTLAELWRFGLYPAAGQGSQESFLL